MTKRLFDSHTHLNSEELLEDIDGVTERIRESELRYVMNVGFDLESSRLAVKQARQYEWCYAAVGCHPHDVKGMREEDLEQFRILAEDPKVRAIGEIGLDFYYDNSPRELQRQWFHKQLSFARQLRMPVIIHDRDAHEETMEILKEENAFETGVLLHCYSGSAEMARQYVKLGAMLSIPGTITFKKAKKQIQVVEAVPLSHLLIETDAPYLTPEPFRGRRNEPAYVRYTAQKVADILGISYEQLAEATCENAMRFFGIGEKEKDASRG